MTSVQVAYLPILAWDPSLASKIDVDLLFVANSKPSNNFGGGDKYNQFTLGDIQVLYKKDMLSLNQSEESFETDSLLSLARVSMSLKAEKSHSFHLAYLTARPQTWWERWSCGMADSLHSVVGNEIYRSFLDTSSGKPYLAFINLRRNFVPFFLSGMEQESCDLAIHHGVEDWVEDFPDWYSSLDVEDLPDSDGLPVDIVRKLQGTRQKMGIQCFKLTVR